MKTLKNTIAILAFATALFSCSKDDDNKRVTETPPVTEKTVNDITITTERVSTPIAPNLGFTGPQDTSWFQLIGNDILYKCRHNPVAGADKFMLKYNLISNSFTSVSTSFSDMNSTGIVNSFVTDNFNAFHFGDLAKKYDFQLNLWITLDYPIAVRSSTGGAGMSYANGKIYACGGGTLFNKGFKSFDITSNGWSNENDYSEDIGTSEMVTVQNKIYLLGGNATNKNFSYFDLTSKIWVAKTNLSFAIATNSLSNIVAQAKSRYIFALQGDKIYVYDIVKDQWKTNPITIPVTGNSFLHLFGLNDNTLLVTGVNTTTKDFALYKLPLNNLP